MSIAVTEAVAPQDCLHHFYNFVVCSATKSTLVTNVIAHNFAHALIYYYGYKYKEKLGVLSSIRDHKKK